MLKCKYCGSEIKEGEHFCPVCSAVAPVKRTHGSGSLLIHEKSKLFSFACIGAILINLLLCILWFCKSFTIGGVGSIDMSMHNMFAAGSSVLSILTIILYIASIVILILLLQKAKNSDRKLMIVPGFTCVWSLVWFLNKSVKASNSCKGNGVAFTLNPSGWLAVILYIVLIPLLVFIFTKIRKQRNTDDKV